MLLNIFQNEHVVNAIGLVLAGVITYAFALLQAWATTKIRNEKVREAITEASNIAEKAMFMIQQTFVDQLKKDGGFDENNQKRAMEKAIAETEALTSQRTKELIEKNFGNFEDWVRLQVEAKLQELKESTIEFK